MRAVRYLTPLMRMSLKQIDKAYIAKIGKTLPRDVVFALAQHLLQGIW